MKYHDFFGAADAASSCKSESAEIKTLSIVKVYKNTELLVEFNHSVFWFINYLDIFSFDGHFCSRLHRSNLVLCKPKKE